MSRRKAIFTQSDYARAIRAAKQCGAGPVQVLKDGSILIHLEPLDLPELASSTEKEYEQQFRDF